MSQGHIRPQGKGSWEIKFDLGRDPLTGKMITKYVTFLGTKRKAQEELTRLLSQRNDGSYIEADSRRHLVGWIEMVTAGPGLAHDDQRDVLVFAPQVRDRGGDVGNLRGRRSQHQEQLLGGGQPRRATRTDVEAAAVHHDVEAVQ